MPHERSGHKDRDVPPLRLFMVAAQGGCFPLPKVSVDSLEYPSKKRIGRAMTGNDEYTKLQQQAYLSVRKAMSSGLLLRLPSRWGTAPRREIPCSDCGSEIATVYDHRDYFEPLIVEPVCGSCNVKRGPATITLAKLGLKRAVVQE